jgi:hypothetical protein
MKNLRNNKMKNIIYQYWKGPLKPGVLYSTKLIKEYADRIGADYRFDHNLEIASRTVDIPIYYEPANPLIDKSFDVYDNVALVDIDVFPVDGLVENIFDQIKDADAAICTEPQQPYFRSLYNVAGITSVNDKRWAEILKTHWNVTYSYDDKDRPLVFNTGVMLISKAGIKKIRNTWPSFQDYVNVMRKSKLPNFYNLFQDYFSAFIHKDDFNFVKLDNVWNSYVHKLGSHPSAVVNDTRTSNTKLVHVMFRTADDWSDDALWRVTNLELDEWNLPLHKNWPNDPV